MTTIPFIVPEESDITVSVYNINGQHITDLVSRHYTAGQHSVAWNAGNAASGMYFVRMKGGDAYAVKKLLLIK